MKVVINSCYGGYSLSAQAIKRIAELSGKECYFFHNDHENYDKYIPVTIEECSKTLFFSAFSVSNPNDYLSKKKWYDMSEEEKKKHNEDYENIELSGRPENRSDPLLIQVIEELGDEANGSCAKLRVVEIPDGVDYVIEEYDGNEWISEKHRTWS